MASESFFEADYARARARFLATARSKGARLTAHALQGVRGAAGEDLTIDVAVFGDAQASAALLDISGVHGQEAFAGSAAQLAYLERAFAPPPAGVKHVFVHGLNPWGFSHLSRGNENHVDLSRNFLDFETEVGPANLRYAEINEAYTPDVWTEETVSRLAQKLMQLSMSTSRAEFLTTLTGGQSQFPRGAHFTGTEPEQSHRILKSICERELSDVELLAYLEWHTGLGEYAKPFFISPCGPGTEALGIAQAWFGDPTIGKTEDAFGGDAQPSYSGLIATGVQRFLPKAMMVGSAVEFGTLPLNEVAEALMIDRWLRFGSAPADPAFREAQTKRMMEALNPSDPAWRKAVEDHGVRISRQAVEGLLTHML
jgi:hypothetical protein